ncbi:MAG: hypothetical protein ACLFS4_01255 [Opitutales bacterium]
MDFRNQRVGQRRSLYSGPILAQLLPFLLNGGTPVTATRRQTSEGSI